MFFLQFRHDIQYGLLTLINSEDSWKICQIIKLLVALQYITSRFGFILFFTTTNNGHLNSTHSEGMMAACCGLSTLCIGATIVLPLRLSQHERFPESGIGSSAHGVGNYLIDTRVKHFVWLTSWFINQTALSMQPFVSLQPMTITVLTLARGLGRTRNFIFITLETRNYIRDRFRKLVISVVIVWLHVAPWCARIRNRSTGLPFSVIHLLALDL